MSPTGSTVNGRIIHPDDEWYSGEQPCPDVTVTDNPIVGTLLGPNGEILVQIRERPPIGFR